MKEKKCFIIMPIATPEDLVELYAGDENHFKHVLEHLFIPAFEKIGIEPIPPTIKGAEIIHAEIIKNIEISDFLLCDMSTLNPNVFFELGIRTAVNKPVALVKDDATPKVPFDTNIINHHTYLNSLAPWTLDSEIDKLSEHLKNCFESPSSDNSLWKYFSLSSKAATIEKPFTGDEKIDYLSMQVEALRKGLESSKNPPYIIKHERYISLEDKLFQRIVEIAGSKGVTITSGKLGKGDLEITISGKLPEDVKMTFEEMASVNNIKLKLRHYNKRS